MRTMPLLILTLLLPLTIASHADDSALDTALELPPYSATYEANFNGIAVSATRNLDIIDGSYRLSTKAKSFLGSIDESETFRFVNGQIIVDAYQHERSMLGSKRKEKLIADHNSGTAYYTRKKKNREITLQPDYLGPMSYQLQIRRDLLAGATTFDYQVMHRGKVREYRFELTGEETLTTPAGDIECVTLKRVRDDNKRETQFWMAKNQAYLLVKLRQKEDNDIYELTLASITNLASSTALK